MNDVIYTMHNKCSNFGCFTSYFAHLGSLLPVFGVRVSVTFHLTCVYIIFILGSVAEWPPFGK